MHHKMHGHVSPGFDEVARAFAATLSDEESGAALSVRLDGRTVIDLWGGVADGRDGRAWISSTPSTVFSCTKGLVSILAAHLVDEGRLNYDALVTDYWPEFGVAGKAETRVSSLLSHRAGLSATRVDLTLDDIVDWHTVVGVLQEQEPLWTPGSGWGYHALTHGWLVGEVIRRISGMSVGEYFRTVVAGPLDAEAWIGLPETLVGSPAYLQIANSGESGPENQPPSPTAGGPVDSTFSDNQWMERAMTLGGALHGLVSSVQPDFNDSRVQAAQIPGAGGIATARAMASIWSATVVATDGVRLLSDEVIKAATVVQSEGPSVFSSERPPHPRWGMGFMLDSERRRFLTSSSFGHDGAGGQVGFADPEHRVGFGYITNRLEAGTDNRAPSIIDALRRAL